MSRQIKLPILLAALLAGGLAVAVDKAFKTYRNVQYGFEVRYPYDSAIVNSSAEDDPVNQLRWGYGMVVRFIDGQAEAWTEISVKQGLSEDTCISSTPAARQKLRKKQKLNGFYVGEAIPDASMSHSTLYQSFMIYRKENCYEIDDAFVYRRRHTEEGNFTTGEGADEHKKKIMDIVKSFRFLDSEPKVK